MESNWTLKIKDPSIRDQFTVERNKDIIMMCTASLIVRVTSIIAGLVHIYFEGHLYDKFYWAMRASCIGWHLFLLLMGWKWPLYFSKCIGPLLLPGFTLFNLVPVYRLPMSPNLIGATISTLLFFMYNGLILNYSWIFTAISLIVMTLVSMAFYCTAVDFRDLTTYTHVLSLLFLIIYSCYFYEKKLKLQFI